MGEVRKGGMRSARSTRIGTPAALGDPEYRLKGFVVCPIGVQHGGLRSNGCLQFLDCIDDHKFASVRRMALSNALLRGMMITSFLTRWYRAIATHGLDPCRQCSPRSPRQSHPPIRRLSFRILRRRALPAGGLCRLVTQTGRQSSETHLRELAASPVFPANRKDKSRCRAR